MSSSRDAVVDILLVEDSLPDVRLTREALRDARLPLRLHVAYDGAQAMAFLKRCPPHTEAPRPHLILLDLNLPRMDGREVLAALGEDASLTHIPVVILTTSQAEQDVLQCYRLGANAYVTKSVDLDECVMAGGASERVGLESVTRAQPADGG